MTELGFRTTARVRPRRGRGCLAVFVAFVILGGAVAFVAVKGQAYLANAFTVPDYSGPGQGEIVVEVSAGDTSRDIAETLESKDVVKSAEAFTRAARKDTRALGIQPGYYRLRVQMGAKEALGLILDPTARILERVTVPEGRRVSRTVAILSDKTGIPVKEFSAVLKDPESLELPPYAKGKPEGMLFPATYDIDPGTTAGSLLQQLVARHVEVAEGLGLTAGARKLGVSPRQVVTVASLVEAEARRPQDFPRVARVIYNRLAEQQKLELDSTVHYAVNRYDTVSTTPNERDVKSPYNTYRNVGLPPGPINSPGERALQAALKPAPGQWLFFVTVNPDSGETKFAQTYSEHDQYVAEFQ
ncbi:MAG: endolytic transglycosylase MltG, partial [Actinopolymorphaceae bacterium]